MSDHWNEHQQSGEPGAGASPESETLPAELAPLDRKLLADGSSWRAGLPSASQAMSAARARIESDLAATPTSIRGASSTERLPTDSSPIALRPFSVLRPPEGRDRKGQSAMIAKRTRSIAAGVAAVAVVLLLALLLRAIAIGRSNSGTGSPAGPVQGKWQTLAGLSYTTTEGGPSGLPAIAPTDPRTVSRGDAQSAQATPYHRRRQRLDEPDHSRRHQQRLRYPGLCQPAGRERRLPDHDHPAAAWGSSLGVPHYRYGPDAVRGPLACGAARRAARWRVASDGSRAT